MLYDPYPTTPNQLRMVALTHEQFHPLSQEFDLTRFTPDRPYVVIQMNPSNHMYLNVRDPEDDSLTRQVARMRAIQPIGENRGIRKSTPDSIILLMEMLGVAVEWHPCGRNGPLLPFQTCFNASSAIQLYYPQGS